MGDNVTCGGCLRSLDEPPALPVEERKPCPRCGSLLRLKRVEVGGSITPHSMLAHKVRQPGHKDPVYHGKSGSDFYRDTGTWRHVFRLFDHINNRYQERITDPETGAVLREVDELLTDHQGHGSAKGRPPKKGNQ